MDLGALRYRESCYVAPWENSRGSIVLIHGVAECGKAWIPCVPWLSRYHRVVIPDLPGCGKSQIPQPMTWSLEFLAELMAEFIGGLFSAPIHLVGSKFGGTLALCISARRPDLVQSLTVLDLHIASHSNTGTKTAREAIRRQGLRRWAADTMNARLGSAASSVKLRWWTDYMASADMETTLSMMSAIDGVDLEQMVRKVTAPTLLVASGRSPITTSIDAERWAGLMADATVHFVDGDAYHSAAAYPDLVARRVNSFIDQHSAVEERPHGSGAAAGSTT